MATTDTATGDTVSDEGVAKTAARSLLTQYWPFTVYVLMYSVVGIALASTVAPLDYVTAAIVLVAVWFGLEGLHAIDLAHDGVAVNLHGPTQRAIGYAQVALGGALGVYVAYTTSWLFLTLVPIAVASGLAYNEEWFDGLFHDRDKIPGLANFGLSWGFIPAMAGYVAVAEAYSLGMLLVALGIAIDAAELNYLVGPSKMVRYRDMGIPTTRDYTPDPDVMEHRMHFSQKMQMVSWALIGVGVFVLLAL